MSLKYIDLFSGAGGLSSGFDKAGFENVFAIEFNEVFANTYKKNFPNHNLLVDDIKNISNNEIKELVKGKEIDVVIGGPPCQGFSIAGKIGRSFLDDERNMLFKEYVRMIGVIKPKMFMMENVAALERHRQGKTLCEIKKAFKEKGYYVESRVLNAVNYGIAQNRRRIVMIGAQKDSNIKIGYPNIDENQNKVSVSEAIEDLPALKSGEKSTIPNHNAMKHSEQMLIKMSYVKDGGDRNTIPLDLRPKSGDIRKYIRYNSKEPSFCVTGDMRKVFHYSQNRALTSRELARLQSFDDDFIFYGNSIQVQQQIGNAVPPKLAYKLAESIKEAIYSAEVSKNKLYRE